MGQRVSFKKSTKTYDEHSRELFIAQSVKSMQRMRAKGHCDWKDCSDEKIQRVAESMAHIYHAGEVLR